MKKTNLMLSALAVVALAAGCKEDPAPNPYATDAYQGVVINEISAHDEQKDVDTWIEIANTSSNDIDISNLNLYLSDEFFDGRALADFTGKTLKAGEKMVFSTSDETLRNGFASNADFTLVLGVTATEGVLDKFEKGEMKKLPVPGSYQRLPDGTGEWKHTPSASKGRENRVLTLENTTTNAIWLGAAHSADWLENDCAVMKQIKASGIDHILLNFAAFADNRIKNTRKFLEKAAEHDLFVHIWMQAFYQGGWVSPVIDEENRYDQELFDTIVAEAKMYVEEYGAQGIHLDYIRFGGTAYKHNPSREVTAVGAVNECCRQVREAVDACADGIVMSAAMMAENNAAYYYGQNPAMMCEWIDIFMPMIYRHKAYGVKNSDDWCKSAAKLFTQQTKSQVWAGITTYQYEGETVVSLPAEEIRSDAEVFLDTKCTGIVLFRYGLGTYPDLTDLWK